MTESASPATHSRKRKDEPRNLTDAQSKTLPPGEYQDSKQPALRLYVSDQGVRTWGLYKWLKTAGKDGLGAPIRMKVGNVTSMNVRDARIKASELAGKIDNGIDPRPSKRTGDSAEKTLRQVLDMYSARLKDQGKKQWYWAERKIAGTEKFAGSYADWLNKPLSAITRPMLEDRQHEIAFGNSALKIKKRGVQAATISLKALRAVYAYAEKKELYAGKNIAKMVDMEDSPRRERVMSVDEKDRILNVLDNWLEHGFRPYVRPFFRLLILTGVRWGNLVAARWEDINLKTKVWTIPAAKSKGSHEMRIQLRGEAIELLEGQKGQHKVWVFPSPNKSSSGHLMDPMLSWKRVLEIAEVKERLTPHDLRRSFGSLLLNKDVNMAVVSKALGHRNVATTARYYAFVTDAKVAEELERVKG
jgi:integrase